VEDLPLPSRVLRGDFRGWLRTAMRERGVSQRALAMRTGVSHSTISRLLSEDRTPSLDTAVAIIRVLGPRPLQVLPVAGRREVIVGDRTCPACARLILLSTG
jgi:transcriptional regulator with XRE-family HTH domain